MNRMEYQEQKVTPLAVRGRAGGPETESRGQRPRLQVQAEKAYRRRSGFAPASIAGEGHQSQTGNHDELLRFGQAPHLDVVNQESGITPGVPALLAFQA